MQEFTSYMWSVTDWRNDDIYRYLTNQEKGIYRELIDECWINGSIPSDPEALAVFVGVNVPDFAQVWAKLRRKFIQVGNGERLTSKRLEKDRQRLEGIRKKRRKASKLGNEARWKTREESQKQPVEPCSQPQGDTGLNPKCDPVAIPNDPQTQTQTQTQSADDSLPKDSTERKKSGSAHVGKGTGETTARRTRAPAELPITDAMRGWASDNGITTDLEAETAAMLDHHRGKGNLHSDWVATWRTWMRNSKRFRRSVNRDKPQESAAEGKVRRTRENAQRVRDALRGATGDRDGPGDPAGTDRDLFDSAG